MASPALAEVPQNKPARRKRTTVTELRQRIAALESQIQFNEETERYQNERVQTFSRTIREKDRALQFADAMALKRRQALDIVLGVLATVLPVEVLLTLMRQSARDFGLAEQFANAKSEILEVISAAYSQAPARVAKMQDEAARKEELAKLKELMRRDPLAAAILGDAATALEEQGPDCGNPDCPVHGKNAGQPRRMSDLVDLFGD